MIIGQVVGMALLLILLKDRGVLNVIIDVLQILSVQLHGTGSE
jgi:hypothetical protein